METEVDFRNGTLVRDGAHGAVNVLVLLGHGDDGGPCRCRRCRMCREGMVDGPGMSRWIELRAGVRSRE